MKRLISLLIAAVLLLTLAGCSGGGGEEIIIMPDPSPTPVPEGMQKVFGKNITVTLFGGEDGEAFFLGAEYMAKKLGIPTKRVSEKAQLAGADLILAYMPAADFVTQVNAPMVVYCAPGGAAPASGSRIFYDGSGELATALEMMFNYSSHDAPVRIFGMFSASSNAATAAFEAMNNEGKLYIKGTYSGEGSAFEWAKSKLSDITPGLLDTIFCENTSLAIDAFSALKEANRSDVCEAFCPGINKDVLDAMIQDHFLFGGAAGANLWSAGAMALRMGASRLAGETVNDEQLETYRLFSDGVYAAKKEAGDAFDPVEYMITADEALAASYYGESVAYLLEYAGAEAENRP